MDAAAILEGEPAATPVILNDRAYTIRVRFPEQSRTSLDRMSNTLITSSTGARPRSARWPRSSRTRARRKSGAKSSARCSSHRSPRGSGSRQRHRCRSEAVNDLHLPSSIRVEYGGLYEEQQKSFHDLVMVLFLALLLLFVVLLFEFRTFSAPSAILASACSPLLAGSSRSCHSHDFLT